MSIYAYEQQHQQLMDKRVGKLNVFNSRLHLSSSTEDAHEIVQKESTIVNQQDAKGNTPLMQAAMQGREDLAKILLENGAQVNMQNFQGQSALYLAVERNQANVVLLLLKCGAQPNLPNIDSVTPLHIAAASGNVGIVRLLKEHGAHINVQDDTGDTPLHYATREGQPEVVRYLMLECGADPLAKNEDGETPADLAVSLNEMRVISVFQSYRDQTNAAALHQGQLH
jgi:ankyrin repeat protein